MVALTGKTRLRLPFDVLPGAVYLALLSLPALSEESGGSDGGTDLELAAYGGPACTGRSGLHLTQSDGSSAELARFTMRLARQV